MLHREQAQSVAESNVGVRARVRVQWDRLEQALTQMWGDVVTVERFIDPVRVTRTCT